MNVGWPTRFPVLWSIAVHLAFFSLVSGTGVFELQLKKFENDRGVNSDGHCCNGIRRGVLCTEQCRTFFRICLTHYQKNIPINPHCTFGEITTPVLGDNSFPFPNAHESFSNPIKLSFDFAWPGTFSLIVEAWHDSTDHGPQQGSPREMIFRLATQRSVLVGESWTSDTDASNTSTLAYSYRVVCHKGNYGSQCTNVCHARDDQFGHYTCSDNGTRVCLPGWQGDYCHKAMCLAGCHPEHGHCEHPNECKCKMGWEGANCDQCILYPGCQHGRCNQPWQCNCDEGWGGIFCNQDLNYCTHHNPCKNGATCTNAGEGSYSCKCTPGFTGTNCELEVDDCLHQPCLNGGTCMDKGSDYQCQCPQGFHGRRCESSATSCEDQPCQNEGTCSELPETYRCTCKSGYKGVNCEIQKDECGSNPCIHGGRCVDQLDGFRCICPSGYRGERCQEDVNDCTRQPCLNGGTCVDRVNDYECRCRAGYVGPLCQINVDECEYRPCANGGTCHDLVNDFQCDCAPGFIGKDCRENVDECQSSPCKYGGTCLDRVADFQCVCKPGFTGKDCSQVQGGPGVTQWRHDPTTSTTSQPHQDGGHTTTASSSWPVVPKTVVQDESVITLRQLLLIICLGVGIPILIIVLIIVLLLVRRRRTTPHIPDHQVRKDNQRNEVANMNNKCIDPSIVNAFPPSHMCVKNINEEHDSRRLQQHQLPSHSHGGGSKLHHVNFDNSNSNTKVINKNNIDSHIARTSKDICIDRDLKAASSSKVRDLDYPSERDCSDSLESSVVDASEYTRREVPADVHIVKSVNTEANSNSIFFLDKHHGHSPYSEAMLATEV